MFRGKQFRAINFSVRRWKKERVVLTVINFCQSDCNMVFVSHIFLPVYLTKIYVNVQVFWHVISCFGVRDTEVPKETTNSKAWRNIPGGLNIQQHHCENVRFHLKHTVPLHALHLPNQSDSFYKCWSFRSGLTENSVLLGYDVGLRHRRLNHCRIFHIIVLTVVGEKSITN